MHTLKYDRETRTLTPEKRTPKQLAASLFDMAIEMVTECPPESWIEDLETGTPAERAEVWKQVKQYRERLQAVLEAGLK